MSATTAHIDKAKLLLWLPSNIAVANGRRYRHRLINENTAYRSEAIIELRKFVSFAHEDARRHLRSLVFGSLDPLAPWSATPSYDPAEGYPERLHLQTLKGYFGEIFAAVVTHWMEPFGEKEWHVPAFLFRHHAAAFHELETMRQTESSAIEIPGRLGDDSLAFKIDGDGRITHVIYCESKCLVKNNQTKIAEAHEKVSAGIIVNLKQLVEVLRNRPDPEAKLWIGRIRRIILQDVSHAFERLDLVSYICGNAPVRGGGQSWIPRDTPHEKYTAGRQLEVVEAHLGEIDQLVEEVYRKEGLHGVTNR